MNVTEFPMSEGQGRHFLQIPGPSPVPDRILRAIGQQVIDHRGPEFKKLGQNVLEGIRTIFKTSGPVVIYPSSGTGAWEAAIVNTLSPGDKVLMIETGHPMRQRFHGITRRAAGEQPCDVLALMKRQKFCCH